MLCEVILDASVEEVAAYNCLVLSREKVNINIQEGNIEQRTLWNNNHSFDYCFVKDLGFGLSPRRFLSRNIWKRLDESGKIIIAFEDATSSKLITENDNKGKKQSYVEASNFGCFFMEPVEEDGTSFSTTKLTYIARVSLGGYVPHLVVEQGAAGYLSGFSDTRKLFNKDYEIDLARRNVLLTKIRSAAAKKGLDKDKREIARAKKVFHDFESAVGKRVEIETSKDFVSAVGRKVEGEIWCKLSTTVRCSGDEALGFLLDVKSRSLLSERDVEGEKSISEVSEQVSD